MIYFDIETIGTTDESVIQELRKTITPPATIKKPESIERWFVENEQEKLNELVSKTSLNGLYGRVACIAWAIDDREIFSTHKDMSEEECINLFYSFVEDYYTMDETLCGHNITGFDLPFLKHRSIILGIKPPVTLLNAMRAKPWDDCVQDTMLMWSTDRQRMVSMHKLCNVLRIDGKGDFDGSMVAETWPTDPEKVIEYCKDDVRRTREIYKRLSFAA